MLSEYYFFIFIFILTNIQFDVNCFLGTSTPTARAGIPTSVQKTDPTSAGEKGRWCKLAIVPPLHTPNESSSYILEYLVMDRSCAVVKLCIAESGSELVQLNGDKF